MASMNPGQRRVVRTAPAERGGAGAPARYARHARWAVIVMTLSGCAAIAPAPQPVRYVCDGGRGFAVTYRPEAGSASIEIAGMRFQLESEHDAEGGERYACSVLTLWRDRQGVRVDLQGEGLYANCRPQP